MQKNNLTGLLIIAITTLTILSANAQTAVLPDYWGNLKTGEYAVGFKSSCVYDITRKYDLTCGDSTVNLKNLDAGRPILINIWYPALKNTGTTSLAVKDFFSFPPDENAKQFFTKLKDFQYKNSKVYAINENLRKKDMAEGADTSLAGRDARRAKAFDSYLSAPTVSHRDAVAAEGEFPIVIYHQGLGGTIDENYVLLEYLASNGYIAINSAFQVNDGSGYDEGWFAGVGDYKATFEDFNFIINYCHQKKISKSNKVYLAGHSYGGNTALTFLGEGHQNVAGLIPLDCDYGYVLSNFFPGQYNPFVKEKIKFYKDIPVFCASRSEAHFRMVDSLTQSRRYFLTIAGMVHNDFTSQGGIGRYYCLPYAKEKEKFRQVHQNYLNLCASILKFLDGYSKTGKGLEKNEIKLYEGWRLETAKPGEKSAYNTPFNPSKSACPNVSQFLDIFFGKGMQEMKKAYAECPDTALKNTIVSDLFDALYEDEDTTKVYQYLKWTEEVKVTEKNLEKFHTTVFYSSLLDSGKGFHFKKAAGVYHWIIEKYPRSKYGYLGMALVSMSTHEGDAAMYCKKVIEIDPGFLNTKGGSFWDEHIIKQVKDCLEKK